eukprot:TRINITY_DN2331_c0_g1_i1.p1 TRINITY_DN2331_c0_g1~~TRINITY_DN2331_c0_g1_i1.p1  ORF type:complete len:545 (-),score=145.73 TRINITY_DN2331_c0_g1_i1:23-1657(-)
MTSYTPTETQSKILCCLCGLAIEPNPSNMCVNCIRTQVDITEGIPKQVHIQWCKFCGRYLQPPNAWLMAELESPQLLTFCIKRINGLSKVKLIDAGFIWTEPHSKRLKVKVKIQKEVMSNTILQQSFVVEFVVMYHMCESCHQQETPNKWNAVSQVRQRVNHKRTFFYLEQLILKHNIHAHSINIKERPDGIDFYFATRGHAIKFNDFISSVAATKLKLSKRLITADEQNGTATYKFTFSLEMSPLCKDDLVCLPKKVAQSHGNITPLLLVHKVHSLQHFVDPRTLNSCEIGASSYWCSPFKALCAAPQLTEFIVLDVNEVSEDYRFSSSAKSDRVKQGGRKRTASVGEESQGSSAASKFKLVDVEVARNSDLGKNDVTFNIRSHLGRLLHPGDSVLGYDIERINFAEEALDAIADKGAIPSVILVRKHYPNRRKKKTKRIWKLKTLEKEELEMKKGEEERKQRDYEMFLRDLEEDKEMRATINMYKDANASSTKSNVEVVEDDSDSEDEEFPDIELDELMEEMAKVTIEHIASSSAMPVEEDE